MYIYNFIRQMAAIYTKVNLKNVQGWTRYACEFNDQIVQSLFITLHYRKKFVVCKYRKCPTANTSFIELNNCQVGYV